MIFWMGCTEPAPAPAEEGTCDHSGPSQTAVVSSLLFARAEDGVSEGFDLDGDDSVDGDVTGCGIADYTDPRGLPGIDNGFARIIPALMATEAQAVEGLVQSAINSGELLLMFDIAGLDDTENDACVSVEMTRGGGTPSLGTDGTMEWSQTFDRNGAEGSDTDPAAEIVDGSLVARPLDIVLPIQVLNADLVFEMRGGGLRVNFNDDGSFTGAFGGALDNADLIAVSEYENVDKALAGVVTELLTTNADLGPDGAGVCQQIAINFEFTAVPAFFFE